MAGRTVSAAMSRTGHQRRFERSPILPVCPPNQTTGSAELNDATGNGPLASFCTAAKRKPFRLLAMRYILTIHRHLPKQLKAFIYACINSV